MYPYNDDIYFANERAVASYKGRQPSDRRPYDAECAARYEPCHDDDLYGVWLSAEAHTLYVCEDCARKIDEENEG